MKETPFDIDAHMYDDKEVHIIQIITSVILHLFCSIRLSILQSIKFRRKKIHWKSVGGHVFRPVEWKVGKVLMKNLKHSLLDVNVKGRSSKTL